MPLAYHEHYTVDDYNKWEGDWELIHGAPYAMTPSPSLLHQRLKQKLSMMLGAQLQECPDCEVLFEIDVHLSQDTIVRPDVVVVCGAEGQTVKQTPELIIEILSTSSKTRDEVIKKQLYAEHRIAAFILVDPIDQSATVFKNPDKQYGPGVKFKNDVFSTRINNCPLNIDFSQLW